MKSFLKDDLNEILSLYPEFKNCKIFVETGTFKGGTVKEMSPFFEKIYTVEYSERLYTELKKINLPVNIESHRNNSEDFLKKILPSLKGQKIIFFLDAHWAGIETGFYQEDCPLLKELKVIKENCNDNLIIIDDYNKFETVRQKNHYRDARHTKVFGKNGKIEDWKDITLDNVLKITGKEHYKILNNRLII